MPTSLDGITHYCNSFKGDYNDVSLLVGASADWNHKFGRCGYNENEEHISDVSVGGECRNQPGTPCIYKPDFGYYMCENTQIFYYAQEPSLFRNGIIIHELMHHFGGMGNFDHMVG